MSEHDLLFCHHLARLTHSKKLSASSKQKITSLIRAARIGVPYRVPRRRK